MLLPTPAPEEVTRFQKIYKEEYGIEMPAAEALAVLTRLVHFYYLSGGYDAHRQHHGLE